MEVGGPLCARKSGRCGLSRQGLRGDAAETIDIIVNTIA